MKNATPKIDWSRARGLLADLKSATRRSLSAQILLGKELSSLKRKLGFTHGGDRKGSSPHVADLIGEPRTWKKWCESELQISDDTAARWVQCFEAALKRAKARKLKEPEACRLLEIPAAELTSDELERLAACVDRLVDQDTQAGLLEELGILKPSKKLPGGDTSAHKKSGRQMTLGEWALEVFTQIEQSSDDLEKSIERIKDSPDFKKALAELDLEIESDTDAEARMASLMSTKESLERTSEAIESAKLKLEGTLTGIVSEIQKDVDAAIKKQMHGPPPKRGRPNLTTTGRK